MGHITRRPPVSASGETIRMSGLATNVRRAICLLGLAAALSASVCAAESALAKSRGVSGKAINLLVISSRANRVQLIDPEYEKELKSAGYNLHVLSHEDMLTADYLRQFGVVVLANVDFGGLKQRKMIRNYVADGGRVVLLGGNHALKRSSFVDTFVSDMLPFNLTKDNTVVKLPQPAVIRGKAASSADEKPAIFWRHVVERRSGSVVLAWAGKTPVSLRRAAGKGVVTAFVGTVLGTPKRDETPFWKTQFWKDHLNTLVRE